MKKGIAHKMHLPMVKDTFLGLRALATNQCAHRDGPGHETVSIEKFYGYGQWTEVPLYIITNEHT